MKKHEDEVISLLRGFAGGNVFVDELTKQVDEFSNSVWESVAAETEHYLAWANELNRFAGAIERVTKSVLSDGKPVEAEKVDAAKAHMNNLRTMAEKLRSVATDIRSKAEIKGTPN